MMNSKSPEDELLELAYTKMPFGKYKGRYLSELPEPYLVWFHKKGFPEGKLGQQLRQMHEIKVNGLETLIRQIRLKMPQKND